jgi:hypothetical protein
LQIDLLFLQFVKPRDSAIFLPVFAHGAKEDTIFLKFIGVLR